MKNRTMRILGSLMVWVGFGLFSPSFKAGTHISLGIMSASAGCVDDIWHTSSQMVRMVFNPEFLANPLRFLDSAPNSPEKRMVQEYVSSDPRRDSLDFTRDILRNSDDAWNALHARIIHELWKNAGERDDQLVRDGAFELLLSRGRKLKSREDRKNFLLDVLGIPRSMTEIDIVDIETRKKAIALSLQYTEGFWRDSISLLLHLDEDKLNFILSLARGRKLLQFVKGNGEPAS